MCDDGKNNTLTFYKMIGYDLVCFVFLIDSQWMIFSHSTIIFYPVSLNILIEPIEKKAKIQCDHEYTILFTEMLSLSSFIYKWIRVVLHTKHSEYESDQI